MHLSGAEKQKAQTVPHRKVCAFTLKVQVTRRYYLNQIVGYSGNKRFASHRRPINTQDMAGYTFYPPYSYSNL